MRARNNLLEVLAEKPNIKNVLLDMDGTIVSGKVPIPGAREAMRKMLQDGKRVIIFTNRTTTHDVNVVSLLGRGGGFVMGKDYTDILATGDVLKDRFAEAPYAGKNILVFGSTRDLSFFDKANLCYMPKTSPDFIAEVKKGIYDYVYVTVPAVDGKKVTNLEMFKDDFQAIVDAKLPLLAGHMDSRLFEDGKFFMVQGDVVNAIQDLANSQGKRLEVTTFGKPKAEGLKMLLEKTYPDFTLENTIMVGDTPLADIKFGKALGVQTVLVMTNARKIDLKPSFVIPAIGLQDRANQR